MSAYVITAGQCFMSLNHQTDKQAQAEWGLEHIALHQTKYKLQLKV